MEQSIKVVKGACVVSGLLLLLLLINHVVQSGGKAQLHILADKDDNLKLVELTLKLGADPNMSIDGVVPLHVAAERDSYKIMELLLDNGARLNAKDNNSQTALHKAAANNSLNAARVLLSHGADVNALDGAGKTPAQLALERNYRGMAVLLTHREER